MIKDKNNIQFESLLGKTIVAISGAEDGSKIVHIKTSDGKKYTMSRYWDGSDTVSLVDTCGDISDIIGSPILLAENVVSTEDDPTQHYTWSFYKLSTIKGSLTLRWCGYSECSGYYSEDVGFYAAD
jgi:hypothetical protein